MQYEIRETKTFSKWLKKLKDIQAKESILKRLIRVKFWNLGDYKPITVDNFDIYELRFFVDKGYRVYFTKIDNEIILLLCGGNKDDQKTDIKKALLEMKQEM